jgi:hypothetical protein
MVGLLYKEPESIRLEGVAVAAGAAIGSCSVAAIAVSVT